MNPWLVALLLALVAATWLAHRSWRSRRLKLLRGRPFPAAWHQALMRNCRIYRRLPPPLRHRLHGLIHEFLDHKTFHGCDGFEITDEVRATVAAQACLLLLNRDARMFPGFSTILIYPSDYVARFEAYDGPVAGTAEDQRAGESWQRGPVVLSWQDVLHGASRHELAFNVVIHEFAHKLDEANSDAEGLPVLDDRDDYEQWSRVLRRAYETLCRNPDGDEVLDGYAASSPAEFFAVASEAFFEEPQALARCHAELYHALMRCYRLDPRSWAE